MDDKKKKSRVSFWLVLGVLVLIVLLILWLTFDELVSGADGNVAMLMTSLSNKILLT